MKTALGNLQGNKIFVVFTKGNSGIFLHEITSINADI